MADVDPLRSPVYPPFLVVEEGILAMKNQGEPFRRLSQSEFEVRIPASTAHQQEARAFQLIISDSIQAKTVVEGLMAWFSYPGGCGRVLKVAHAGRWPSTNLEWLPILPASSMEEVRSKFPSGLLRLGLIPELRIEVPDRQWWPIPSELEIAVYGELKMGAEAHGLGTMRAAVKRWLATLPDEDEDVEEVS